MRQHSKPSKPPTTSTPPVPPKEVPTKPPADLLDRLNTEQKASFISLWDTLPPHLRSIKFDLHGEGWTADVIKQLGSVLSDYQDVFSTSPTDLGSCPLLPFKITVPPDSPPVRSKPYRMNPIVAKQVDVILDKYLAAGLIQHSTSPYCSPIVVVPKKSGGLRIAINYQRLNKVSSMSQLPVPRVDEILTKLNKGNIFSLFDFTGSFHQIPVHPDTIPLTAFATPTRLFEWLRMPMGASQSAGHFVKVINEVIKGMHGVEAYLDDVVVFDETPAHHVRSMRAFFQRLRTNNLKLSPPKATIGTTHAAFLGHTITPDGVSPNPDKVAALAKMPMPTDLKQLRSLLGGLGYYRSFLKGMAKRTKPLNDLLKKNTPFVFTNEMEATVRELLAELSRPPVLVFPDWDAIEDQSRPFRLHTDASQDGLGATLEQEQPSGDIKPIVFISRATLDAERNWTALDLEAGAVVWSIKRLRGYLRGTKFRIFTDSSALENMAKIADHNPRVSRWTEFLTAYQYTVHHRPGSKNGNADMLSRLPLPPTEEDLTGHSRLSYPDEVASYTIRASASLDAGPTPAGVGLGGLLPPNRANTLGGLPLTDEDFSDFRRHGPRIKLDTLPTPSGEFERRATTSKFAPKPNLHLRHYPYTARADGGNIFAITTRASAANRLNNGTPAGPPVSSARPLLSTPPSARTANSRDDILEPPALHRPLSSARANRHQLNPAELISKRTRRGVAAAAGRPQPPVTYQFSPDISPVEAPPPRTPALRGEKTPPRTTTASKPTHRAAVQHVPVTPPAPTTRLPAVKDSSVSSVAAPASTPPLVGTPTPTTTPGITPPAPGDAPGDDARLQEAELQFKESVENFTHRDWAAEQGKDHICKAALRYIDHGRPDTEPTNFFPSPRELLQPSFAEVRELAHKGRIVTTDDGVRLFARKLTKPPPTNSTRPGGRAARLLHDEHIRIYVPMTMRPWVMLACHSNALCHLGTARTLALLERFYWWVGMSISTPYWVRSCHKCQARKSSRHTVRWPIISIPLPSGPGYPSASTILVLFLGRHVDIRTSSCSPTDSVAEQICMQSPTQTSLQRAPPTSWSTNTSRYGGAHCASSPTTDGNFLHSLQ